jgi:hypothetical protein
MCRVQSEEQRLRENLNQEFHSLRQQMFALQRRLHYLYMAIADTEKDVEDDHLSINHLLYAANMSRINANS